MSPLTTTLRAQGINYRWGNLAKLLIHYKDITHGVATLEAGIMRLKNWGLPTPDVIQEKPAKVPRMSP
ncbi:Hypothetical predicted protein, partial [Pelobates cultripes]